MEELAALNHTIPYETICIVGKRGPADLPAGRPSGGTAQLHLPACRGITAKQKDATGPSFLFQQGYPALLEIFDPGSKDLLILFSRHIAVQILSHALGMRHFPKDPARPGW